MVGDKQMGIFSPPSIEISTVLLPTWLFFIRCSLYANLCSVLTFSLQLSKYPCEVGSVLFEEEENEGREWLAPGHPTRKFQRESWAQLTLKTMALGAGKWQQPLPLSSGLLIICCVLSFVLSAGDRDGHKMDIVHHSALLELESDNRQVISISDKGLEDSKTRWWARIMGVQEDFSWGSDTWTSG